MSVNLSRRVYNGGVLQFRDSPTGRILHEMRNTGFGDALLFTIRLEHRLTNVVGSAAKTAFAGWFKSQPNFRNELRRLREGRVPAVEGAA